MTHFSHRCFSSKEGLLVERASKLCRSFDAILLINSGLPRGANWRPQWMACVVVMQVPKIPPFSRCCSYTFRYICRNLFWRRCTDSYLAPDGRDQSMGEWNVLMVVPWDFVGSAMH